MRLGQRGWRPCRWCGTVQRVGRRRCKHCGANPKGFVRIRARHVASFRGYAGTLYGCSLYVSNPTRPPTGKRAYLAWAARDAAYQAAKRGAFTRNWNTRLV